MELIQGVVEQSWHARADRRFTAGQVIDIDPIAHTCTLDVGARDVQNSPVYLHGVPFSPQTPPSVGDVLNLSYANSSPHSISAAGGQLGGMNGQNSITVQGAVSSITAGALPTLRGAVQLAAGSGVTFTQASQVITISATIPPAATTVSPVAPASNPGTLSSYAREDHAHAGVHSVTVQGQVPLLGDIVLQAGSYITLAQAAGAISISATLPTGSTSSWNRIVWAPPATGSSYILTTPSQPTLVVVTAAPAGVTVNLPPAAGITYPIAIKNYSPGTGNGIGILAAAGDSIQGNTGTWNLGSATGEMVLLPADVAGQQVWMILSLG